MTERTPAEQARAVADWLIRLRASAGFLREEPHTSTKELADILPAANAVAEYLERQADRDGEWQLLFEQGANYQPTHDAPVWRCNSCGVWKPQIAFGVAHTEHYDTYCAECLSSDIFKLKSEPVAREDAPDGWVLEFLRPDGEWAQQVRIYHAKPEAVLAVKAMTPVRPKEWRIRSARIGTPAPAVPAEPPVTAVCEWRQDGTDVFWGTGCGNAFIIEEGPPSENQMRFCCYCGGELREVLASQEPTPP